MWLGWSDTPRSSNVNIYRVSYGGYTLVFKINLLILVIMLDEYYDIFSIGLVNTVNMNKMKDSAKHSYHII